MARQAPGRNQDSIKTDFKFGMLGMCHQPGLGGLDDSRLLAPRQRNGGVIEDGAGLDLDKGQQSALARHEVDLAIGRAKALCQDAIAFGHQESGGAALGGEAGSKCRDPRWRSYFCQFVGRCGTVSLRHRYPWGPYLWRARA